ncbi:hypothetical protein [Tessaracoccus coleopterorum]|uniref:hypothetical protein n=1 Tax=Tessaracoccus coleopterorum TaxID=2714950 RepID=UPI001E3BBB83|nr:hypothetical protein [Tessaracoccus coleopterorum]
MWQAVDELSQEHPILARTADPTRAGGRRATATRLARLLRWYVDVAPELVSAWLEGSDEGRTAGSCPSGGRGSPSCCATLRSRSRSTPSTRSPRSSRRPPPTGCPPQCSPSMT